MHGAGGGGGVGGTIPLTKRGVRVEFLCFLTRWRVCVCGLVYALKVKGGLACAWLE